MARETDEMRAAIEVEAQAELEAAKATWPWDMRHRFTINATVLRRTGKEIRERRREALKRLKNGPWFVDGTHDLVGMMGTSPASKATARRTLDGMEKAGLVERYTDNGRECWRLRQTPSAEILALRASCSCGDVDCYACGRQEGK